MVIFKSSKSNVNIFVLIVLFKMLFIFGKVNSLEQNTIILEIKSKSIEKSVEEKEKRNNNIFSLIINKLVPNTLYIDFELNSKNLIIPGYLTFTIQYNFYGLNTCMKLENENIFNINYDVRKLPTFQLYNSEFKRYYYIRDNISIYDINNNSIFFKNVEVITSEINENKAKCLIVGLNPIVDLKSNNGIKNLPLAFKSNKIIKNNNYITILYNANQILMLVGEPPHKIYPNLYNIKAFKEIDNYKLRIEFNSYYMKNLNNWSIKLDQIFIGNESYTNENKFVGQFSLDYIPFIVPMDFYRKYLSKNLDNYILNYTCREKSRPLNNKFAHSIINDKKQTFVFIYCDKNKIENLSEFYEKMPEFSFSNKELNKTFKFEGKSLISEVDHFLVLMIMPDLFNKNIITLGKIFMEKYSFCFNYDRNTIGFYNEKENINNINNNNNVNNNRKISYNKIPIEFYYILISIFLLVFIFFIFKLFKNIGTKGNSNPENKDNNDDLIEKELIEINKEN